MEQSHLEKDKHQSLRDEEDIIFDSLNALPLWREMQGQVALPASKHRKARKQRKRKRK